MTLTRQGTSHLLQMLQMLQKPVKSTMSSLLPQRRGLRSLIDIKDLDEFKTFMLQKNQAIERTSPTFALANQTHGPATGFYHDNGRKDPIYWFKLQHMGFRDTRTQMVHPTQKYGCTETELWNHLKRLPPVYEGRVAKGKIIFDAGDVRSTVDDSLLQKSSNAAQRAESLRRGARHQTTDGHVYTPKLSVGYLTVNLGNFVRGRKCTLPAVYANFIDEPDDSGVGPMVKSLARSKSHLILLNEASQLVDSEIDYLRQEGWLVHQNNAKDLAIMVRCNFVGSYINQIAGSNMQSTANKHLPLSYMLCEVCFGKCPSQEEFDEKKGSRNLRDYDHTNMSKDLARAGMNVVRVWVFHMKSRIASRQPGFCHEAYGIMLADCFAFQAGIMSGDANMSAYRYAGSRQQSSSIKHSCWQDMVRYFVQAHNNAMSQDPHCRVIPRFVSSNPLSSLRWWEDAFGQEYESCRAVNWDTVPTLDCLVSCILDSISMEKWSQSRPGLEYKVQVSELHSTKDDYLFSPTDKDSHAPLLVHLHPHHFTAADLRATQRPESKMDRNTRRKDWRFTRRRQLVVLHLVLPPPTSETTSGGTGSSAPTTPPQASGTTAPVTPPESAPTSDKGKSKAKGKREASVDVGKGKSKSKGDSHREKGKARDTHYGKGKGQK